MQTQPTTDDPTEIRPLWEREGPEGLRICWLGRRPYEEVYRLQENLVQEIRSRRSPEVLLLVEHDAVYTIGRTRDQTSLGAVTHLPHPLVEINRGGQATFHGPGQLVGYPLLDLERRTRDLHGYLRKLEGWIIRGLAHHAIEGTRREGLTGVWVGDRKIASIGVGVRRWVTMHGIGLNIGTDLSGYAAITPCGITGVSMTSLNLETGGRTTLEEMAHTMADLVHGIL